MNSFLRKILLLVTLLISARCNFAQVPTATLNGSVVDAANATVSGARLSLVSADKGILRETLSDAAGFYTFTDLGAGAYDLTVQAPGFANSKLAGIVLLAGRATTIDVSLRIASSSTSVNVIDDSGSVELTQSMIQGQITSGVIENIPLNGRNFLELAYLVPGNRPAPTFDPTKTNTLEVSSAGGFGRGGNITVDGGDNNDEVVGGTLSNFPEDSIQEFQIATGRFTAEVGRSGNSIINVITKSGGNAFHGSAFIFERNRNLQGLPATFDRRLPAPPFDREQFGGSVGGPIRSDKAWFFASVEYRDQNAPTPTATRIFSPSGDPAGNFVQLNSAPAPLRDALFSTRFDQQLSSRSALMVRYSFNRSTDTGAASPAQSSPSITAAERQNSLNRFNSIAAALTTTVSSSKINSIFFHYDNFFNNIPVFPNNSPTTNPVGLAAGNELLFPSVADGANFNSPQATFLTRYQIRDSYSWILGKHSLHLGGEWQHYAAHGHINVFGSGSVILTSDFGFNDLNHDGIINDLDIPIAVALKSSAPVTPVPIPPVANSYIGSYIQDDWRVRPNLTLNLGLRWEFDTDLLGNDSSHGPCPSLTETPTQPCVWLANVIDLHRNRDKKDFAPRIGFAWDPFSKGKTSLRGGYGIYYDRIILEAPSEERVQDDRALTVSQFGGSSCTFPGNPAPADLNTCFAPIPGVAFAPGSPTLASPFSGQHQTGGVGIIVLSPDSHHPIFQQFSLGVQQQIAQNWLLSADGLHVFGNRQLIGQSLRTTSSSSQYISCPGNNAPCSVSDPLTGISDNVTEIGSFAKSWYDGLIVSLQRRPTKIGKLTYLYNLSYTLSKTLDYSDDDQLTNNNQDEQVNLVQGTTGLRKEKGYAATDERHRITAYGNLQMPWGFSFSPIYTFGSGVPADTFISGLPVASDPAQTVPSRLPILARNALGRSIQNSNQLNSIINIWNALPACPAPAPCHAGPQLSNVPANINFFSPFSALDFRLTKEIRIAERLRLSLIGEAFNIFNASNVRGSSNQNFSGRNVTIAPAAAGATTQQNFYQPVSIAGGFFGSGGPRAFQFAARLSF